jgi:hypothetical protein
MVTAVATATVEARATNSPTLQVRVCEKAPLCGAFSVFEAAGTV